MSATPFVEEIRLVTPDAENVLRCFRGGDAIRDVVLAARRDQRGDQQRSACGAADHFSSCFATQRSVR